MVNDFPESRAFFGEITGEPIEARSTVKSAESVLSRNSCCRGKGRSPYFAIKL